MLFCLPFCHTDSLFRLPLWIVKCFNIEGLCQDCCGHVFGICICTANDDEIISLTKQNHMHKLQAR